MNPATQSAIGGYKLFHDGVRVLSHVERHGIRVDVDYLNAEEERVKKQISVIDDEMRQTDEYAIWDRKYPAKMNLNSTDQLRDILFDEMGYKPFKKTLKGRYSTDAESLRTIDSEFVRMYLRRAKLSKLLSTYLRGIKSEVVDGYIHPHFSLHLVRTFRSSSSNPNFQNIPVRDKDIGKSIRSAFVPRHGHMLLEVDYSAIEVRVGACYHQDPTMIRYIKEEYDMHTDMAAECFLLSRERVTKQLRQAAKGLFVFASFYGDYYKSIARNLWDFLVRENPELSDGVTVLDHLRSRGISRPGLFDDSEPVKGTFEWHIKRVEDDFWNRRFAVYNQWRRDWYDSYKRTGKIELKTGFVISGCYKRNEVINYPVQGSAFHCLLWSLIELHKELLKRRMKSLIIGQIHDSILLDVWLDEYDNILTIVREIMCERLRVAWPWIIVPLQIEAEASAVNWYEKKPVTI